MPDILKLYEGHVTDVSQVQTRQGREYVLISTKENTKPLAVYPPHLKERPAKGAKISVQAKEWSAWWFAEHRSIVAALPEPQFPIELLPNASKSELAARIIMWKLTTQATVTADDIYEDCIKALPNADPRWIGQGFRVLSKQKVIHKVGYMNSVRVKKNHARDNPIWELTKK